MSERYDRDGRSGRSFGTRSRGFGSRRGLPVLLGVIGLVLPGWLGLPAQLEAQGSAVRPLAAASGRVTTSVAFDGRLVGQIWLNRSTAHSGPALLTLDYGQPHARGRVIYGELVPWGEVWRLGANMATHLTTDVNLRIGTIDVPRGMYSLYLVPRPDGADLVVNRMTRQWGTEYDAALDLGRTAMEARTLLEPAESLALELVPAPAEEGVLPLGWFVIRWGDLEYRVRWAVTWP